MDRHALGSSRKIVLQVSEAGPGWVCVEWGHQGESEGAGRQGHGSSQAWGMGGQREPPIHGAYLGAGGVCVLSNIQVPRPLSEHKESRFLQLGEFEKFWSFLVSQSANTYLVCTQFVPPHVLR